MSNLQIFAVAVLLSCLSYSVVGQTISGQSEIFQSKRLSSKKSDILIKSKKVSSKLECTMICSRTDSCRSVNVQKRTGAHKIECELLSKSKRDSDTILEKRDDYDHIDMIDPCKHSCFNGGTCTVTSPTGYTCTCAAGFKGHNCKSDINECSDPQTCHVDAECNNTHGSYFCKCKTGFNGDGQKNCSDINECAASSHSCDSNAVCNNTKGSFMCTCKPGYLGNGQLCVNATTRGLEKSSILSNYGNVSYLQVLTTYLDPVLQDRGASHWNLCWHANSDGWDVQKQFHPKCDGRGPSVTIVRVNQYIFGGYTDVSWHKNGGCSPSNQSFLYSLYNIKGYQPVKLNLTGRYNKHAILGRATVGPTFGCSSFADLIISNKASSNDYSYSYLGLAYQTPLAVSHAIFSLLIRFISNQVMSKSSICFILRVCLKPSRVV